MTSRFFGAVAVFGVLSLGLAQRDAKHSYSLTKDFKVTAPLSSRGGTIVLTASRANKKLEVQIGAKTQTFMLETIDDSGSPAQGDVLVEDFDFDGFNDVGVPSGIGYGGVNNYYDVWRYEPRQKQLVKLEGESFEVSNPVFDPKNKILLGNARSGPFWYGFAYKFSNNKPWLYRTSNYRNLLVFDKLDTYLEQTQIFNKAGGLVANSINDVDKDGNAVPVKRTVPTKMFLYSAAKESAKTANYIIRGDTVLILEVAGKTEAVAIETEQWVKIAYQSKKLGRIVRWLHLKAQ